MLGDAREDQAARSEGAADAEASASRGRCRDFWTGSGLGVWGRYPSTRGCWWNAKRLLHIPPKPKPISR